jgi:simple sugar transport system permease protein
MSRSRRLAASGLSRPEAPVLVLTLVAIVVFGASSDEFLSGDNLATLLPFFAPFAILAVGQVLVMASGEIDLSIGSVFLLSPFLVERLVGAGAPLLIAVAGAIACCGLVGLVNGLVTQLLGVPSFVTTLGTLLAVGGLTLVLSGAAPVAMPGTSATGGGAFADVFGGSTASQLLWALGAVAVVQVVLTRTRWGRHALAVGGNRTGSAQVGIPVDRVVVRGFVACAAIAGLVGVLEAVRTGTAAPDTAAGAETMFRALSAAVIGGTLLRGGSATAVGALLGALFLGVLRDGLTLRGLSADYLDLVLGCVLLVAVALASRVTRPGAARA